MNAAQYALHRGVKPPTVTGWVNRGYLNGAFKRKGRTYEIDHLKADVLLENHLNPAYRRKKPNQAPSALKRFRLPASTP